MPNKFGWNEQNLKRQFEYAKLNGWLPYVNEFARLYNISAALILAIASRETNMRNIRGDYSRRTGEAKKRYHGYAVMQVDINTDPKFCANWTEHKVRESFERGVQILGAKMRYLEEKGFGGDVLKYFSIAAYNGGEGRALKAFLNRKSGDNLIAVANSITTGNNYVEDVLEREKIFDKLLKQL